MAALDAMRVEPAPCQPRGRKYAGDTLFSTLPFLPHSSLDTIFPFSPFSHIPRLRPAFRGSSFPRSVGAFHSVPPFFSPVPRLVAWVLFLRYWVWRAWGPLASQTRGIFCWWLRPGFFKEKQMTLSRRSRPLVHWREIH